MQRLVARYWDWIAGGEVRRRIFGVAVAIASFATPVLALDVASVTQPQAFTDAAAGALISEIELGNLAAEKATSPGAQFMAKRVSQESPITLELLWNAASADGLRLPTEMDDEHRLKLDRLGEMAEGVFDHYYVSEQIAVRDEIVNLFTGYSLNGPPGALQEFATHTVPTLLNRLDEMRKLSGR